MRYSNFLAALIAVFIATSALAAQSNLEKCSDALQNYKEVTDFYGSTTFESTVTLRGKIIYQRKLETVSIGLYDISTPSLDIDGMAGTNAIANGLLYFYRLHQAEVTATDGSLVFNDIILCRREIGGGNYTVP